jgi:hypothetical protein
METLVSRTFGSLQKFAIVPRITSLAWVAALEYSPNETNKHL